MPNGVNLQVQGVAGTLGVRIRSRFDLRKVLKNCGGGSEQP